MSAIDEAIKVAEREVERARHYLVIDAERLIAKLEYAIATAKRSGVINSPGELQSLAPQFDIRCAVLSEREDLLRGLRAMRDAEGGTS